MGCALALVAVAPACDDHVLGVDNTLEANGPAPDVTPAPPALRRLTLTQYHNAIDDLFGEGLVVPSALEPDVQVVGLLSVGASVNAVSPLGVERYEDAATLIALQVAEEPARLTRILGCTPAGPADAACAESFVTDFGLRVWRRPLVADEIETLTEVITWIGADSGSFAVGAQYGITALLQSPNFLYRTEHGPPGARATGGVLTNHEIATRLSFLLWNTIPDAELLEAAASGELATTAGVAAQVERMLLDPQAVVGLRNFFIEVLQLHGLETMGKDPTIFTHASPELGVSAGEETLLVIERLVLDEDGDLRDLFTTRRTFIDRRLAALYDVQAPGSEGFGEVMLPRSGGRRGLLGHASTLALHAHDTRSSSTKRGAFLRNTLLCQTIPPPPPNVDTSIPDADATSPTLRQRIRSHLDDPACASCHALMDPIGLGLENFDGIGRWRDTENGAIIDASGDLDGDPYEDAWELGQKLRDHPDFGPCMTEHLYQYAVGHPLTSGEYAMHGWLAGELRVSGHSFRSLLIALATSESFRRAGAMDE